TAARAAAAREARQVLLTTVVAEPPRNGTHHTSDNGHLTLSTLDRPDETPMPVEPEPAQPESTPVDLSPKPEPLAVTGERATPALPDVSQPEALKAAFVRQLQLDRLTMRQMRSLLMSEE